MISQWSYCGFSIGIIMEIPWKHAAHAAGCFMMSGGNFYTLGKEQQESLAPEIHEVQHGAAVQSFHCQRPSSWPFGQSLFWRSNCIEADDFHYSPGLPPAHLDVSEMKFLERQVTLSLAKRRLNSSETSTRDMTS